MTSPTLRIAVLGPGLSSLSDPGLSKRMQIRAELAADGHDPFIPEEEGSLAPQNPFENLLDQEIRLLSSPDVHLVIILHTKLSAGVLTEIAGFVRVPEIKCKTAVLYPAEFYKPNESLAANTVRDYFARIPYTDEHFEVCQLVEECRYWARNRQVYNWPGLTPFQL